ncbi:MAG: hypothetical protein EZS28_000874 [Streblomastix strix]|uniref:IBB domain-containing protein n=1 Tax=Streblomastix strix TaxID=222440 RepID=A0A5J4X8U4_9EUKA|nr:MAG: hypothetical protein EZS28_000874 [Streblomastix strix]
MRFREFNDLNFDHHQFAAERAEYERQNARSQSLQTHRRLNQKGLLSKDYEFNEKLTAVVIALKESTSDSIFHNIHQLRLFISGVQVPPIDLLVQLDAINYCSQLISHFDMNVQFEAVWVIANIASGSDDHSRAICFQPCFPSIIKLADKLIASAAEATNRTLRSKSKPSIIGNTDTTNSPSNLNYPLPILLCEVCLLVVGNIAGSSRDLRRYARRLIVSSIELNQNPLIQNRTKKETTLSIVSRVLERAVRGVSREIELKEEEEEEDIEGNEEQQDEDEDEYEDDDNINIDEQIMKEEDEENLLGSIIV